MLNEFHPVALAAPLLLWAFLYIEEGRWLWALPFLVLAAACKETVPLVIGTMGVYFAIRKRSWRPLILAAVAAVYFVVAVWAIIPHFNGEPERLHRALRRLRPGRRRGGQDGAHPSRPDCGRPRRAR